MLESNDRRVPAMAELLAAREVRGLRILVITRQVALVAFSLGTVVVPNTSWERWVVLGLMLAITLPNYWLYRALERRTHPRFLGALGASFDLGLLVLVPLIWYQSAGGTDVPTAYFLKSSFPNLAFVFIAANGMALRPRYPLAITVGSIVIMLAMLGVAVSDARTNFTTDYVEVMLGGGVSVPFYVLAKIGLLLLAGLIVASATSIARKTVFEAANLERTNATIRAERDRIVLQEKIASISSVVAGIAHEVNTPVGVIQSNAATIRRGVERLEARDSAAAGPRADATRVFGVLRQSADTTSSACDRIASIVATLESFAKVDAGSTADVDLNAAVRDTSSVTAHTRPATLRVNVELAADLKPVRANPREISELVRALLAAACADVDAHGTLWIETRQDEEAVFLDVARDGATSRSEDSISSVDVRFESTTSRVRAAMDLPLAHAIAHRYGGDISVMHGDERALTYRVRLPVV